MPRTEEQQRRYNQTYYYKHQAKILEQKKEYLINNKEKVAEYRKNYYETTKEEFILRQRAYYGTVKGRQRKILMKSKERAKKAGLEFDLKLEDIVIPEYCPYLGIRLTHELGKGQQFSNSSIDRIDNTVGYVKDNIQIISRLANSMKTNSTREQRIAFANAVLQNENL